MSLVDRLLKQFSDGLARSVTASQGTLTLGFWSACGREIPIRVVSMPSTNVFDRQDQAYKDSVLPKGIKRVAVEAGVTGFWHKYVGLDGAVIGMDCFGESAPAPELFKHFGFTVENVVKTVKSVL